MCLTLSSSRVTKPTTVKTVYKNFAVHIINHGTKDVVVSPRYRSGTPFVLKKGKLITSSRKSSALNAFERDCEEVSEGLHSFVSKEMAIKDLANIDHTKDTYVRITVKCEVAPEHFVATGLFNSDQKKKNVVSTKLKPVEIVGVYNISNGRDTVADKVITLDNLINILK